jgi:hypothetical protein
MKLSKGVSVSNAMLLYALVARESIYMAVRYSHLQFLTWKESNALDYITRVPYAKVHAR